MPPMRLFRSHLAGFLVLLAAVSGCTQDPAPEPGPTPSPTPDPLAPVQLLEAQGNNDQCTNVLVDDATYAFTVPSGYHEIEVSFHASGLGQVGYEIRDANGTVVASRDDENPTNQPCTHAHSGASGRYTAPPGDYDVSVRNLGILGWHLVVTARAAEAQESGPNLFGGGPNPAAPPGVLPR